MKPFLACLVFTAALASGQGAPPALPEPAKIDEILAKSWSKQGLQANPAASDEVFLRRIYLDIAGRIPTTGEAEAFLNSKDPQKRGQLIDALLDSDAYASNFFNYFADILRLQTDTRGSLTGHAYANWLKAALKKNQPYDAMVRELLTTDGAAWDSGAIGFYMRDRGMPLDHLAATVQIFLGTRIECAQCHNHPFDKWSQMDYYKMAAFTFGVDARRDYQFDTKSLLAGMDRQQLRGPEGEAAREKMKLVQESVKPLGKMLLYTQIKETDKLPKLPDDYKYPDAKPGDTIQAKTMFGHEAAAPAGGTRLDAFANWMTDPQNPRFTTVIANRLWKKVMGMGLIEPVDELTDSTVPSHPELMTFLEELMAAKKYDLKAFLRVLCNSQTYQSMPSTKDVLLGESYGFTGPLMRRMSAEQAWDSVATLIRGNLDADAASPNEAVQKRLEVLSSLYDVISAKTPQEIATQMKSAGRAVGNPEMEAKIKGLTEKILAARSEGDLASVRSLSAEIRELRDDARSDSVSTILGAEAAGQLYEDIKGGYDVRPEQNKFVPAKPDRELVKKQLGEGADRKTVDRRMDELKKASGKAAITGVARASELPSPAPRGHMLRIFGQSDRETIENASREANVPQALAMLNGPVADALINPASSFGAHLVKAGDPSGQMDSIYLGLLSRYPTDAEREMLAQVFTERGHKAALDIIHALLNTGEFLFVK